MESVEIIGKLRAVGFNREADALMQVYMRLSSLLAERNKLFSLGRDLCEEIAERHDTRDCSDGTAGPNEWMALTTAHQEFFDMVGRQEASDGSEEA